MSFASDLKVFQEKTGLKVDELVQSVAVEIFSLVIKSSPVGNPDRWKNPAPPGYVGGRFRANWFCSIGAPSDATTEATDKIGDRTQNAMVGVVETFTGDGTIYLVNNLPYSERIEGGWSKQAPTGVVAANITIFEDAVRDKAQQLQQQ